MGGRESSNYGCLDVRCVDIKPCPGAISKSVSSSVISRPPFSPPPNKLSEKSILDVGSETVDAVTVDTVDAVDAVSKILNSLRPIST